MTIASGGNLFPNNFAREVFPHFNLPPLHSLMEKEVDPEMVFEEVKKKNKVYNGRVEGIRQQTIKCYIFISKEDNDSRIFELELLIAAFHFVTHWKSFEHELSIDKKRFDCMCE